MKRFITAILNWTWSYLKTGFIAFLGTMSLATYAMFVLAYAAMMERTGCFNYKIFFFCAGILTILTAVPIGIFPALFADERERERMRNIGKDWLFNYNPISVMYFTCRGICRFIVWVEHRCFGTGGSPPACI